MFPSFISIIDIQSWWEVPSIAHFCSLFRTAFNLLDFDIEDLEEALLTDGTEEPSWLQDLIVKLLSGCLPNNEISTFNYQMFLRRLFRQKCQEHDRYNPFNTDVDFQLLPLRTKVDILYALCDFRLDAEDVLDLLKNLESDSLRVEPLGHDNNDSAYWYFYGTRLYREDFKNKNKREDSVWQVICFTQEDWFQLAKKFKKSTSKAEKHLFRTLSENFLPELPRLFQEKEKLARKRLLEKPRKSSRIQKLESLAEEERLKEAELETQKKEKEESLKKKEQEIRRKEAYERRAKKWENSEDSQSEKSESRYEMVATKARNKKNNRERKSSRSSTSSQDRSTESGKVNSSSTSVGRQTNNSLASATGQIVIQPVSNPHRKKLKTSQVFRQTDEDLQTGMHKILDHIKDHEDAWPFIDPVEEEYAPNYYSIIRKPMDLQKMEERLDSGYYKTYSRFHSDFKLIVDNCRLYNGVENEYTEMVDNLLKAFERATKRYLDQISSSDDEIAVEFPEPDQDSKQVVSKKRKSDQAVASPPATSKRKPTLAAQTDKRNETESDEEIVEKDVKIERKRVKSESKSAKIESRSLKTDSKNVKSESKNVKAPAIVKKEVKGKGDKQKKGKGKGVKEVAQKKRRSPSPENDRWSSSPPPSWPPSSPESVVNVKSKKESDSLFASDNSSTKGKDTWKSTKENKQNSQKSDKILFNTQQKDKHNKLRETIEKLKAKSDLSKLTKKEEKNKKKKPDDTFKKIHKSDDEDDHDISTKFKEDKPRSKIEELTLATEQTLKDINKWLDDTPGLSEFSSASNSPSHFATDDFDLLGKKTDKNPVITKKEPIKEVKRRPLHKDSPINKLFKRREIHRTIDRLQPGKSKGNLLSNVQAPKTEDPFPLGPLSKLKDTKNSLIVKTDDSAPKLSLGTVLDSFGKHKFVDETKKEENEVKADVAKEGEESGVEKKEEGAVESQKLENKDKEKNWFTKEKSSESATPNLSAWFKAFGVPKVQQSQKKSETKPEPPLTTATEDKAQDAKPEELSKKIPPSDPSPNPESPASHGQPAPRQRKISTGSSMSERSSFSQDMDSPRVGMDERMGAYPAPYPSPLHRSPSGVSPVMASPRPDLSPKAANYNFNGNIRVGFYQDTVSTKSSPDKACSPRDGPQSPYAQYSEHLYLPHSSPANPTYSYGNPYTYNQNTYTNPSSPLYSADSQANVGFYDTNKPLTDQYQAKQMPASGGYGASGQSDGGDQEKVVEKQQNAVYPVKKRAYNEAEQMNRQDFASEVQDLRNTSEIGIEHKDAPRQQYIPQNIPDPKALQQQHHLSNIYSNQPPTQHQHEKNQHNGQMPPTAANYPEAPYTSFPPKTAENISTQQELDRKIDMSKYTNMGYTGTDVSFGRNSPQFNFAGRVTEGAAEMPEGQMAMGLRHMKPGNVSQTVPSSTPLTTIHQPNRYTSPMMDMELRGNLSHIVDRFSSPDERLLSGVASAFYGEKSTAGHMFNKPIVTSASGLPMPMQYGGRPTNVMGYNRQLQQQQQTIQQLQPPQQQQQQGTAITSVENVEQQDKKGNKRKKASKTANPVQQEPPPIHSSVGAPPTTTPNQGFQSYAGLKTTMEPSAISLKTASVVPGSAFNFGPAPAGLGLYGDKEGYPNFLDDFRAAPNYYMAAAAAAHHRTAPEMAENQVRAAHQTPAPQAAPPGYPPFLGAPQARPPGYPPFMAPHQAQLMDPSSPLYQQYMIHQGLLGPTGAYPAGYHPALSIRQPYDAMTRPSWL